MNTKCKYIIEVEKKINQKNTTYKMLIGLCIIVLLFLLHINEIEKLFLDSEGNFSNEIFWCAVSAIGSIIALGGVMYTIRYTEKSRITQNEYEYQRQQLVEEQLKFKEQVMEILNEVNLACVIEIITRVNEDNFFQISQELNRYRLAVKNLNYKLYWYYNSNIQLKSDMNQTKLQQFANKLNDIIDIIETFINEYSNKIIPIYVEMKMQNHFEQILRLDGKLNEEDTNTYKMIKNKYLNKTITEILLQSITEVSSKVIEYSNKNWNDFVNLAKEVVNERENIIEDILKKL